MTATALRTRQASGARQCRRRGERHQLRGSRLIGGIAYPPESLVEGIAAPAALDRYSCGKAYGGYVSREPKIAIDVFVLYAHLHLMSHRR
jgi:hypothetical protein